MTVSPRLTPTDAELIEFGECAVRGHLDFAAARAWLTKWRASPPAVSGPTEAFEHLASAFYEDTGFLAPGKSVPLEMGSERYEDERRAAWEIWNAGRKRVSAVAEGPWRVEDTGDAAPWWMVVSGQGKPPCSSCGREWSGFTRTAFGSAVQLEATAVCDALNRVAAQATQEETHE